MKRVLVRSVYDAFDYVMAHYYPAGLEDLAEAKDIDNFLKNNGMECCECGCCSYVCPAKRHLTQTIAGTRKLVLASRKK